MRRDPCPSRLSPCSPPTPSEVAPVLDHAASARRRRSWPTARSSTYAELARGSPTRAATWGPAGAWCWSRAPTTVDSLVAYLAALQHGHVALVVPDGRADQRDATLARLRPRRRVPAPRPTTCAAPPARTTCTPTWRCCSAPRAPPARPSWSGSRATTSPATPPPSPTTSTSRADDRAITALPLHYCYGLSVLHSHLVAGAERRADRAVGRRRVLLGPRSPRAGATTLRRRPAHLRPPRPPAASRRATCPTLRHVTQAGGRLAPEGVAAGAGVGREQRLGPRRDVRRRPRPPRGWRGCRRSSPTTTRARRRRRSPAGDLRLDQAGGERPGVGELVYTGPNVMLGYAEQPGRPGARAAVDELRTGDLARRSRRALRDGRPPQPLRQGLRPAHRPRPPRARAARRRRPARRVVADRPSRARLRRRRRAGARAPGRGRGPLRPPGPRRPGPRRRRRCRSPAPASPTTPRSSPWPRSTARPADEAPRTAACRPLRPRPRPGRRQPTTDTFVGLGGDSLSYVELSVRLAAASPTGCPAGWHTRPIGELERLAAGEPAADSASLARLDTTVALRALAILFVVATHVDLVALRAAPTSCSRSPGFNFARFQLSSAGGARTRLRARLSRPSPSWSCRRCCGWAAVALAARHLRPDDRAVRPRAVNGPEWDDPWHLWFLEALVALLLGSPRPCCGARQCIGWSGVAVLLALVVLAGAALTRYALVSLRGGRPSAPPGPRGALALRRWLGRRPGPHARRRVSPVSLLLLSRPPGFLAVGAARQSCSAACCSCCGSRSAGAAGRWSARRARGRVALRLPRALAGLPPVRGRGHPVARAAASISSASSTGGSSVHSIRLSVAPYAPRDSLPDATPCHLSAPPRSLA